jgi:Carboxypeptidase regulatory-like domain
VHSRQQSLRECCQSLRIVALRFFSAACLVLGLGLATFAQVSPSAEDPGAQNGQIVSSATKAADNPPNPGSLSGSVTDQNGNAVVGAKVKLSQEDQPDRQAVSGDDGRFSFTGVPSGPFQLSISCEGFATRASSGVLHFGESGVLPPITLPIATAITEVRVGVPTIELAQEQMHEEEQQRALGFIPNFYVTYNPNAVALSPRQKFNLAWKTTIDPVSFALNGVTAGIEQATNEYGGYGQGASGYAKRYGAGYADFVIGTYIGSAVLPSLLKQDPRYFYKGTGSKRSRMMYAIANAVICKGDNGHWQPNYSGIAGSIAAGGISNLYYPSAERGASLIFENTLIGIGTSAGANLLQEFLIRKLTPNLPNRTQSDP